MSITDLTEPLLTPAEVATLFRVDPKTVTRWARAGKLTSIRTLGGHRRYLEREVLALLNFGRTTPVPSTDEPAAVVGDADCTAHQAA
jgi:excisionase family DNA binding protein